MWNILWYTGTETELISDVCGTNISHYSKPSETVFTSAQQLLTQGCIIDLDNFCSSPELFSVPNRLHMDAVGTVKSNRKGLLKVVMNCTLKNVEVRVSYRNRVIFLKWEDKKVVCMLSSVHDNE